MTLAHALFYRLRWLHAPLGLLLLLLQRTPLLRVASTNGIFLESRIGDILKSAFTLAALGSCNSVAGASAFVTSPNSPASATVGVPFVATIVITGAQSLGESWTYDPGTLPPGIQLGYNPGGGIVYADDGGLLDFNNTGIVTLTGTPTSSGTYTFGITAWEKLHANGDSKTLTYRINVSPGANAPPQFTSVSAFTTTSGQATSFTLVATGQPAPTFSATGLPAWATLNATSGTFTGTPLATDAGVFTITFTATNGVAPAANQTFSLTVKTPFQFWQEANFTALELTNPAISGPDALGPDGVKHLVRFALGYSRNQTLPSPLLAIATSATESLCTFVRPTTNPGVTYQIESSPDLLTWSATGITLQLASTQGSNQTWQAHVPISPTRKFFRLAVAQ